MRLTNRMFFLITGILVAFLALIFVILNLHLSMYEVEERYASTNSRLHALHSYFDKFRNLSYPIAYSLEFYASFHSMPIIYVITPTNNRRLAQMADLIRMRNTLWLVPKVHWLLVEDAETKSKRMASFLNESHIEHTHLNEATPKDMRIKVGEEATWSKARGVLQRNKAIGWLRTYANNIDRNGVVYFADDDNTYDIRLFEEMRYTKKVSVWPVAFVGEILYERPICRDGKVVDWFCVWNKSKRPFPIDMAGFAVNLGLLFAHPSARFSQMVPIGMQESHFLSHLVAHPVILTSGAGSSKHTAENNKNELECKADNGTRIYVWHTQTRRVSLASERKMSNKSLVYDPDILAQF